MGSGSSSSSPNIWCTANRDNINSPCPCCHQSPFNPKNKRGNPSIVIRRTPLTTEMCDSNSTTGSSEDENNNKDKETKKKNKNVPPSVAGRLDIKVKPPGYYNILIDVGKTFREACINHYYNNNITHINAVLLTHEHADAILGLDDLRDVQLPSSVLNVYSSKNTLNYVKNVFPYLFPKPNLNQAEGQKLLFTAALSDVEIMDFVPLYIEDLEIIPIPLHHGRCICHGYIISQIDSDHQFVYFSDFRCKSSNTNGENNANTVPDITPEDFLNLSFLVDFEKSISLLKRKPISNLILDCLHRYYPHISHSCFTETVDIINSMVDHHKLMVKSFFLVGMSCDMEYDMIQSELDSLFLSRNIHAYPAYDGLLVEL